MCVVIDANVIGKVFDPHSAEHPRFKPIALWVTTGNGSIIYGGTKYKKELGEGRYLTLFKELGTARRAVVLDAKDVDDRARLLKKLVPEKAFNDEHLIALVGISRCCLVCTDDIDFLPYLKRKDLYPSGVRVPYVYRSIADRKHCCDRLIVEICPKRIMSLRDRKKPKARPKVEI
jgi:hypothetical protein